MLVVIVWWYLLGWEMKCWLLIFFLDQGEEFYFGSGDFCFLGGVVFGLGVGQWFDQVCLLGCCVGVLQVCVGQGGQFGVVFVVFGDIVVVGVFVIELYYVVGYGYFVEVEWVVGVVYVFVYQGYVGFGGVQQVIVGIVQGVCMGVQFFVMGVGEYVYLVLLCGDGGIGM